MIATVYKYGYIRINVLKKSCDLHTRGANLYLASTFIYNAAFLRIFESIFFPIML